MSDQPYEDLSGYSDEELEAMEQAAADAIAQLDADALALKEQAAAEAQNINNVRLELENRKRGRAGRNPNTQGVGFNG